MRAMLKGLPPILTLTCILLLDALGESGFKRPNILLIISDDLGAWMLGCYGNQEISTPQIDRLAAQGVRFSHHYVCTPVCSPSRATLLTGRVPLQHGIHDFLTTQVQDEKTPSRSFLNDFFLRAKLPEVQGQKTPPASFSDEVFLSDILASNGYFCGYAGKWHLSEDRRPQHGNQFWYAFKVQRYQDPIMYLNGETIQEKGYTADLINQRAIEFLETARRRSDPWFLTVSHLNPHVPLDGHPERYYNKYQNVNFETFGIEAVKPNALRDREKFDDPIGNLRKTAAVTTALDDRVGELLDYLDRKKLSENTLVVFVGDNGFLLGRHGFWSKGLASNPVNMYEEVMQVPLIVRWPGHIPEGTVRHELVSFYDFVPSILDLLNIEKPRNQNLCGRSYRSLMTSRLPVEWDNRIFGYFRNTTMIRTRTHKLVLRNGGKGPNELWDSVYDPRETTNHFDSPPYRSVRDDLMLQMQSWLEKYKG